MFTPLTEQKISPLEGLSIFLHNQDWHHMRFGFSHKRSGQYYSSFAGPLVQDHAMAEFSVSA